MIVLLKPYIVKKEISNPLILITGVSDISIGRLETILKPLKENESINRVLVFIDKGISINKEENWGENGISKTCLESIKKFEKIKNESDILLFNEILTSHCFSKLDRKIEFEFEFCSYEEIQKTYEIISIKIDSIISNSIYDDKHLLFNLTPGNKNISISLALNSIRGKRKACYIQQSGVRKGQLETEELNVFGFRDIFAELTE